jgi:hypothetical protein
VSPGSDKDARLSATIDRLAEERDGRWYVREAVPGKFGVITWRPAAHQPVSAAEGSEVEGQA